MRKRLIGGVLVSVMAGCGGSGGGSDGSPEQVTVLSGVINIETGSRIDSDTADGLVQFGQANNNNEFLSAQQLPSDVLAAGYVSSTLGIYPDAGSQTGFAYARDESDFYSIHLQPGQTLILQTFQTRAGNALTRTQLRLSRLFLSFITLDEDITAPTSDPNTSVDSVSVTLPLTADAGIYWVRVFAPDANSDPVRYVLSTSTNSTALSTSLTWPDFPYVAGQAMVRMAAPVANVASALSAMSADARPLSGNDWLVRMPQVFAQSADQQADTLQWIERLRQTAGVVAAVPNYQLHALALPTTEPLFNKQWHYGLINAPTAWQIEPTGGAGVTVAVLDTGLFKDGVNWHPDLKDNVISPIPAGADFVSADFDNDGTGGRDNDPADPGNIVGSGIFHGTHVAGTVAAAVNDLGVTGVAYGATLLPVRVLGAGGAGSSADLLDAINWVASTPPKADIINMSLGGLPFIQALQDAINQAAGKGVLFAAAAGNENTSAASYPAAFNNVLAVAAVDGGAKRASYSNFGSWISLAAPGGDASRDANADGLADLVVSAGADGQLQPSFTGLQGTSMASPHVAGVLALMKAAKANLTQAEVEGFLANGDLTDDLGDPNLGKGLINAAKAVVAASSVGVPKILTPSPASLNFVGSTNSLSLTLQVLGGGSITLDSVTGLPAWASVAQVLPITSGASISLTVTIDPALLPAGQLVQSSLTLNYTDDTLAAKTLDVPLIAQLFSDEQLRDAGRHFVILVNPEPDMDGFFTAVAQTVVQVSNGQYAFSFKSDDGVAPQAADEVLPGSYFLVAGSDLDNDGIICQAGEACAEFPIAGLRQQIDIVAGTPITGVELTTSYNRPVISAATANILPRPGFKGYRLRQADATGTNRAIRTP